LLLYYGALIVLVNDPLVFWLSVKDYILREVCSSL